MRCCAPGWRQPRADPDWAGSDGPPVGAALRHAHAGRVHRAGAQPASDRLVGIKPGAARQDRWDRCAHPGLLAGLARASTLPCETVQALRTLTRARRDLIQTRTATRQRLHDEWVTLFPEFVRLLPTLPGRTDLGEPAVLALLRTYSSAQALAHVSLDANSRRGWSRCVAAAGDMTRHMPCTNSPVAPRPVVGPWQPAVWWHGPSPSPCRSSPGLLPSWRLPLLICAKTMPTVSADKPFPALDP